MDGGELVDTSSNDPDDDFTVPNNNKNRSVGHRNSAVTSHMSVESMESNEDYGDENYGDERKVVRIDSALDLFKSYDENDANVVVRSKVRRISATGGSGGNTPNSNHNGSGSGHSPPAKCNVLETRK